MSFLLDTNVLSELRKGGRADPEVRAWFDIDEVYRDELGGSLVRPSQLA